MFTFPVPGLSVYQSVMDDSETRKRYMNITLFQHLKYKEMEIRFDPPYTLWCFKLPEFHTNKDVSSNSQPANPLNENKVDADDIKSPWNLNANWLIQFSAETMRAQCHN